MSVVAQTPPTADLARCAEEPIHIPGAIQPHGAMLVLDRQKLIVTQASANAGALLGYEVDQLLGQSASLFVPVEMLERVAKEEGGAVITPVPRQIHGQDFDALIHRSGGSLILELEPLGARQDPVPFYHSVQRIVTRVQGARGMQEIYDAAAAGIAELSGFDRVMIYKFDEEWNGTVVAEALSRDVDSYLGQQFPSTDIPAQARELYRKNWLRIIPDSSYQPVPLVGPRSEGGPLDLSFSVLRSVSPVHLEYLRNMRVAASMSVSLLRGDQLWGLIACHHCESKVLPYHVRAACELVGRIISAMITSQEERDLLAARLEAQRIQTQFFDHLAMEENVHDALAGYTPKLMALVDANGAALYLNDRLVLVGKTPEEEEVRALIPWIKAQSATTPIYSTDALSKAYPRAKAFEAEASGLLAISLSQEGRNFILWFRPETSATINWAGNPDKAAAFDGMRIHPRRSFEIWQQRITGRSMPWREIDRQAAQELRNAINALILRRTDRLLRLNEELEQKNVDLNSFAYIASHDLQEPLRGIRETSLFLLEDHGDKVEAEARERLKFLCDLSKHMQDLIEALQHFSKVGRIELQIAEVDLGQLVSDARHAAAGKLEAVTFRVPAEWPIIRGDRVLLKEVFVNLFTNAVKYNDGTNKEIEVGFRPATEREPMVIFVRDNGIGMREKHLQDIFRIFRRLHPHERYGGGTGVGLSVCKGIVERHGGRIWAESTLGSGTTFYFTLSA